MLNNQELTFTILPNLFGICKLAPRTQVPQWVYQGNFASITKTPEELSIVCQVENIPEEVPGIKNWRALKIVAELDFSIVGILAQISTILAKAGISIFVISTYNTDYILVKQENLEMAVETLVASGHKFV